jgi:hypothetical protein
MAYPLAPALENAGEMQVHFCHGLSNALKRFYFIADGSSRRATALSLP